MKRQYDVIVTGGGFSGCAAAVSAARGGAKTLLIEQGGFLGGAAGSCYINPFMPYWTKTEEKEKFPLCRGIFQEILDGLTACGGRNAGETKFHEEYLKLVLDRMMQEAGVEVLFHTAVCGVEKDGEAIQTVLGLCRGQKAAYSGSVFIDATGDANLAVLAGCPTRLGRKEDHLCQPMTLCFRLTHVDRAKFFAHRQEVNALYQKFQKEGKIKNPREDVLAFAHMTDDILHLNSTRIVKRNPTDPFDLTKAEMQAREQMFELFHFLKENAPGCERAELLASASQIGVRESRMIDGEYLLTQEDLIACTKFPDAIAAGNYDIDIHNPEGSGTSHYYFPDGAYYTIPFRSLLPKKAENLLVAGRCISSTHEAQASYRVMPIVCCIGEGAGTAAAAAVKAGVSLRQLDIENVQRILRKNGAFF